MIGCNEFNVQKLKSLALRLSIMSSCVRFGSKPYQFQVILNRLPQKCLDMMISVDYFRLC